MCNDSNDNIFVISKNDKNDNYLFTALLSFKLKKLLFVLSDLFERSRRTNHMTTDKHQHNPNFKSQKFRIHKLRRLHENKFIITNITYHSFPKNN